MKSRKLMGTGVILLITCMTLVGCVASQSGGAYTRTQTRQVQQVQYGTVQSVRQVLIEGTKSPIGGATGAALGGIAGSTVGGGRGKAAATIGGAVLGGLAGAAAEEAITRQPGLEIVVNMDNGQTLAVTQAADEAFYPGERVRFLTGLDGTARITH